MANRRLGGGPSGGLRGNRSFNQPPFQGGSGVSPWQGSNSSSQGLISQITSNPQQLALALTSLLQPQQQNPPSLLSLNTSPGYNRDRDFGRGRDFRRHEPYSKNRQGGGGFNRDRKRSQNQKDQKKDSKKDDGTDDGNEDGETKRDWKDEKSNSETPETEEEAKARKEKEEKEGPYYDVPIKLLSCFVCNKEMWDGESMRKHVKGRAHRQMLDSLEESIHITVNILRENMRLLEEKKLIELNRVQRVTKRFNKPEPESHCNMCDLKFLGKIIAHRKTEGHQRLKHYLHPNCRLCSKEFPSRMEWIEHRLTPDHLRKLSKTLADKVGGADGNDIVEVEEEHNDLALEPILDEPLEMEAENPILEITENLNFSGIQNLMPAYKPNRPISANSLKPFSGFVCELCHRSFVDEEVSQNHLKTRRHHLKFVEALKLKFKEQQRKEKEAKEAEAKAEAEKNGANEDGDLYNPDEPTQEESAEGDASMDVSQEDAAVKEETMEAEEIEEEKPPAKGAAAKGAKAAPAAATPAAVKNGAGPKSKKARK
ncbi:unnamed protein product [Diabrotica balteata]|uniref:C2H2-type domain-containing protein n=1 Tax=Diabrotica balteata TaxID=107213 RepID=A0A9N9SPW6_DIABA|nr:unnamed protein product [Diabrotica balteata]